MTPKIVVFLGRFEAELKLILDAGGEALRKHGCLAVMFDLGAPAAPVT